MIKKSLLTAVICVLLHALFVALFPNAGAATNQWQDNIIKSQKYLYQTEADTCIVGTSLSARLLHDSIPSIQNLAFGGCGAVDGLRIILLIETNLFFHSGSPSLIQSTTEGFKPLVIPCLPSLQEQYSPICLLSGLMMKVAGINPQGTGSSTVNLAQLRESIEREKEKTEEYLLSAEELKERSETMLSLLKQLEEKNVKIVFFEMPINKELLQTENNEQVRQNVTKLFPPDKYTYLSTDTTSYLTTDGMHLGFEEQKKYSHFFKKAINRLASN